jgi:hypothetical protein
MSDQSSAVTVVVCELSKVKRVVQHNPETLSGGPKMGNSEQSDSDGRSDMPVRIAGAVGGLIFGALGLLLKDVIDLHLSLPWGTITFVATMLCGIFFGRAAYRIFRKSPRE